MKFEEKKLMREVDAPPPHPRSETATIGTSTEKWETFTHHDPLPETDTPVEHVGVTGRR